MKAAMPRLTSVLIYDNDLRGRETLVYGFEGDGIKVTSASETDDLPAVIRAQKPQVLILTMRGDGPHPAVARLTDSEEGRDLPRLVLASSRAAVGAADGAGASGAKGFLLLPAFVRDVITAAKLLVGGVGDDKADAQSELQGALSEYGLYFIVRTMVGLGRSGIVAVERSGRKGEIRFSEGDVVSTQVGPLQGHAALHQLLLWEEASLEIKFRPVVRLGQSLPGGEDLLQDCERFLRDFAHATKNIGHAQSLFVQDAERVARLLESIPPEVVPVMRLFDGQRSLGDVLEDSPFRVFDTLRTITRLLDMGIIRRKAIERPTTGFPGNLRRPRDEWVRPSEAAVRATPAVPPTPPVQPPAPLASAAGEAEKVGLFTRKRPPRKRTGEVLVPTADQAAPRPSAPDAPLQASASIEVVAPPRTGLTSSVHGELRVPSRHLPAATVSDVPKVVIDFGAVEATDGLSTRAAELNTSSHGSEGLARPAPAPSIMIDPRLVAEMDALEQTEEPALPTPAPAVPPSSRPPGPTVNAAVVSFVHPSPGAGAPPVSSSAPTIPVVAPIIPVSARRASSEFDAVEKDFFDRELESEQGEPARAASDTDTDLDPGPREPQ